MVSVADVILIYAMTGSCLAVVFGVTIMVLYRSHEDFRQRIDNAPVDVRIAVFMIIPLWPYLLYLILTERDSDD